jgi:putative intracellular protease/amidase
MSSSFPLANKKIAVLVESQYIPGEIKIYRERFAGYGATVDFVSRLWGQPKLRFYSTVEPEGENVPSIEWLEVSLDVDDIDPDDYAAVIMTANYTSVRLRSTETPSNNSTAADVARRAPAVQFFRRVMENPRIIKGAPCHALWLLTPSPDILASRKVICNTVVLADVVNAGAVYTPCPAGTPVEKQVIVDRDLVTNSSWEASEALVDAIKDLIIARPTRSGDKK